MKDEITQHNTQMCEHGSIRCNCDYGCGRIGRRSIRGISGTSGSIGGCV